MEIKFIERSLQLARESYSLGAFPAGAIIVKDGQIIAESTSAKWPKIIYHAESNCIDIAMEKLNSQLTDCIIYSSMEPCLMCTARAYWAGIRKFVYVIRKEKANMTLAYESHLDHGEVTSKFNQDLKFEHYIDLENEALDTVKEWESKNS